jgi:hypothetical protein
MTYEHRDEFSPLKEVYLGDGLYASFDGFMIKLRAPREDGDHWVALEPDVYEALVAFVAKIKDQHHIDCTDNEKEQ